MACRSCLLPKLLLLRALIAALLGQGAQASRYAYCRRVGCAEDAPETYRIVNSTTPTPLACPAAGQYAGYDIPVTRCYQDADGDGTGNPETETLVCSRDSTCPAGYVQDNSDCDDADATRNVLTECYQDLDGDGWVDISGPPSAVICGNGTESCADVPSYLYPGGLFAATYPQDCDDTNASLPVLCAPDRSGEAGSACSLNEYSCDPTCRDLTEVYGNSTSFTPVSSQSKSAPAPMQPESSMRPTPSQTLRGAGR